MRYFWEWFFVDSAIRRVDPVTRLFHMLYETLWVPHLMLFIFCVLTGENYFKVYALILKMIWDTWILMGWWAITHWGTVQKYIWNIVFGSDGTQYIN